MEKVALGIKDWVKKNPLEAVLLLSIIVLAAFLRLYRISEYMTFLGDEGRDVIIVRRLLVAADPILIGPGTSIGNMYLGPLYYYMMAPALLLAGYSPVGPAVQIAILGVITVVFVWYVGKKWFGPIAGLTSALLYSISPVVIYFSRSSWNPNIMPFFALLCIWSTWQFFKNNKFPFLIVAGVSFAFVLQSHYLGLLLAPVMGLYWLIKLFKIRSDKRLKAGFIKNSLISLAVFIFLMSPLVIFDARHSWQNFSAMKKFFSERQTTISAKPWKALPNLLPLSKKVSSSLILGSREPAGGGKETANILLVTTLGYILVAFYKNLTKKNIVSSNRVSAYLMLAAWLGVALLGLGLYKQEIYDHYYGFFFAAPFLLIGGLIQEPFELLGKKMSFYVFFWTLAYIFILATAGFHNSPLKSPPNRQLPRTIEVAEKIQEEAEASRFNLAVIAERNYEDAYQYFLEAWDTNVKDIDPQRHGETVGEYLFVVCELPKEKCDPTHNPKAEVANFGWSKVEAEWEVGGVILYKLAHVI
jgi:4-amino-4-deoxy-L-arabinose transferase-like glycosyltransferase